MPVRDVADFLNINFTHKPFQHAKFYLTAPFVFFFLISLEIISYTRRSGKFIKLRRCTHLSFELKIGNKSVSRKIILLLIGRYGVTRLDRMNT